MLFCLLASNNKVYRIYLVLQLYCIQTEDWRFFMMKQPIVPLAMPKTGTQHFKQRTKNELLLRCKVGSIELSFFSSLDVSQRNEILEKVFAYGTKLK